MAKSQLSRASVLARPTAALQPKWPNNQHFEGEMGTNLATNSQIWPPWPHTFLVFPNAQGILPISSRSERGSRVLLKKL